MKNKLIFIFIIFATCNITKAAIHGEYHKRNNGDRRFIATGETLYTLIDIAKRLGKNDALNGLAYSIQPDYLSHYPELEAHLQSEGFLLSKATIHNLQNFYHEFYDYWKKENQRQALLAQAAQGQRQRSTETSQQPLFRLSYFIPQKLVNDEHGSRLVKDRNKTPYSILIPNDLPDNSAIIVNNLKFIPINVEFVNNSSLIIMPKNN